MESYSEKKSNTNLSLIGIVGSHGKVYEGYNSEM